jgi:pilus assembly protein CpaC
MENKNTTTWFNSLGKSRRSRIALIGGAAATALLLAVVATTAQENRPTTQPAKGPARPLVADGIADGTLRLTVNKSTVLTTTQPYRRVNLAQPDIADLNLIGPSTILVTAKKPGATQLILWDDENHSQVINVSVGFDIDELQGQLKQMFPGSKIEATSVNGAIALRGRVPSLEIAEQAVAVTTPYSSKVLNFLEMSGGQQVMLQVRFAEVSRNATTALGANFGFTDGLSTFGSNIGQVSPVSQLEGGNIGTQTSPAVTIFGSGRIGSTAFVGFLSALRQNNLMRVLAEPNLIAISGQEASFLAGGEFPIPVTQGGGSGGSAVTVEYREFGVRLKFIPVVLGDGRIRLKCEPEVSDLDFSAAVRANGFQIPGLSKRKVSTTIELNEGQTFAIAGLLNSSIAASKDVTPLLGDLPVVGALFRSVRYQRKETELVVLVTPRLVEGMNPAQVPLLPGEKWRDPSEGELFWERDLGGPATDTKHAPTTRPANAGPAPRFHGEYGFTPASTTVTAAD